MHTSAEHQVQPVVGSHEAVIPPVSTAAPIQSAPTTEPDTVSRRKTNRGCWIIGGIGCALLILLVGILVVIVVAGIASSGSSGTIGESVISEGSDNKIAVIDIAGVIAEDESQSSLVSSVGTTSETALDQLQKAKDDPAVKAVLLKMNTPGGEVVASDMIYRSVLSLRDEKPVVTWMSGMGASGGYYIASGSSKIIAHPDTITGSIGVILELSDMQGLYDKLGIKTRVFKSGEFKDSAEVFDADPEGTADEIYQNLVDEAYEAFVNAVATGREMDVDVVRSLADGRVYTGRQAKENGLIDDTGDMNDAIQILEGLAGESDLTLVEYTAGGFWDSLYEYQQEIIRKIKLPTTVPDIGVRTYYLLDV